MSSMVVTGISQAEWDRSCRDMRGVRKGGGRCEETHPEFGRGI